MAENARKFYQSSPYNRPQRPRGRVEIQTYSFFNLGDTWGQVINATSRPLQPRKREPVLILQEAGWAPGQDWTGAEHLASHRDSISGPSNNNSTVIRVPEIFLVGVQHNFRSVFYKRNPSRGIANVTTSLNNVQVGGQQANSQKSSSREAHTPTFSAGTSYTATNSVTIKDYPNASN